MTDLILASILIIITGLAIRYIYKAKKKGVKCIGCPHANECGSKNCGCNNK